MIEQVEEQINENWRTSFFIGGTVIGALIGLATAYLMVRSAEERDGRPPKITTADAVRIGVSTIGLVRGITVLGDNPPAKKGKR
jgi:hypothetical protein